ncbi:amino acid ABC transporter ATP-binding protein [Pseudolactococcus yaeyamensis]
MTERITIQNVHKKFGKNDILKGIDLEIKKGEVIALLGPSGSGKTTFLRCLNFLEHADQGNLAIGGLAVDLKKAPKKQVLAVRKKTSMVFQQYDLFKNKTAIDNILEGLTVVRKFSKQEALKIATAALEKVGLGDRATAYPSQLSGGQQQRVGIARAIALNPELILFDEPTSALDPETVGDVLDVIREVAKSGATMIITTHEMSFAYEIADRIVFMEKGRVVESGTPEDVFYRPKQQRTKEFLARYVNFQPEYII